MSSATLALLLLATPQEAATLPPQTATTQPAAPAESAGTQPPAAQVPDAQPPVTQAPDTPAAPTDQTEDDLVVTGREGPPKQDPLERANAKAYEVSQKVDDAVVAPVAKAYEKTLPNPVRMGIRNILANLYEPIVFVNYLLQFKPGKAAETAGRFAINSTVGVAGTFDIAKRKPFHLPRRANGLANTLGFYGVGPGPYLYLPLVGPTSLRDAIGDGLDRLILPIAVGKPFSSPYFYVPAYVLRSLDQRADYEAQQALLHADGEDPYSSTRDDYLRTRQAEIDALRGRPSKAPEATPDEVEEPAAAPAAPATDASPPAPTPAP